MIRARYLACLAALAVGALVVFVGGYASSEAPAATPLKTTKVTVTMRDYSFQLSKNVVPRGKVIFTVYNKGDVGHDFALGALNKKTPVFEKGGKRTLTVTFKKKGKYLYLCTVGEHFLHGMKGNLTVR